MAIIKVLDVEFIGDGANAPKLSKYTPLESEGSILLLEPGHPFSGLTGIPTNNQQLTNILEDNAKQIIGANTNITFRINQPSDQLIIERTGKGALHFIIGNIPSNSYMAIDFGTVLRNYVKNKANPNFYFSVVIKITRTGNSGYKSFGGLAANDSPSSNYSFVFGNDLNLYTRNGQKYNDTLLHACSVLDTQFSDWFSLFAGAYGAWSSFMSGTVAPSWILYRVYLEDLSISGRSYEEVLEIDKADIVRCFSAGGRYYGDTYTEPTAIFTY